MTGKEGMPNPEKDGRKLISEREFLQELFEQKQQLIMLLIDTKDEQKAKAIESMIDSLNITRDLLIEGQETHYYTFFTENGNIGYESHRKKELGFI